MNIIWSIIATVGVLASCYLSNSSLVVTAASVVGVLFVLGVAFKNAWTNLLGAALALFYGYLSFNAGFYANAVINVALLFPMQVGAVWWWKKTGNKVYMLSAEMRKLILILTAIGIITACVLTKSFGSHMWLHDGISSVLVIVATFLLMTKNKEQWYAWIPYNFLEVLMWFSAASLNPDVFAIFAMRSIFFINSLIGWYSWNVRKS